MASELVKGMEGLSRGAYVVEAGVLTDTLHWVYTWEASLGLGDVFNLKSRSVDRDCIPDRKT